MPRFSSFQRSVQLPVTPAEVYAFHEDPRNITKISPASLRVERVECLVPARARDEFRLAVRLFGVPLEWIGVWEEADPGRRLIDGARKSPFLHWRHQHLFEGTGTSCDHTLMTDRVEYALPWGPCGRLLDVTLMPVVFAIVFMARHRATRNYFSSPPQ